MAARFGILFFLITQAASIDNQQRLPARDRQDAHGSLVVDAGHALIQDHDKASSQPSAVKTESSAGAVAATAASTETPVANEAIAEHTLAGEPAVGSAPAMPAMPAKPAELAEAATSAESAESTESAKPAESAKSAESAKAPEPAALAQSAEAVKSAEPSHRAAAAPQMAALVVEPAGQMAAAPSAPSRVAGGSLMRSESSQAAKAAGSQPSSGSWRRQSEGSARSRQAGDRDKERVTYWGPSRVSTDYGDEDASGVYSGRGSNRQDSRNGWVTDQPVRQRPYGRTSDESSSNEDDESGDGYSDYPEEEYPSNRNNNRRYTDDEPPTYRSSSPGYSSGRTAGGSSSAAPREPSWSLGGSSSRSSSGREPSRSSTKSSSGSSGGRTSNTVSPRGTSQNSGPGIQPLDDSEVDTTSNAVGLKCDVPQWGLNDYVCAEHVSIPAADTYVDQSGSRRKRMDNGGICTVQCPASKTWQAPDLKSMYCTNGKWTDEQSKYVQGIKCSTASWVYTAAAVAVAVLLLGGFCLYRRGSKPAMGPPYQAAYYSNVAPPGYAVPYGAYPVPPPVGPRQ